MKIALFTGHSLLYNKENTSSLGLVDEYFYLKDLAPHIANELKIAGYDCDLFLPPEFIFSKPIEEVLYKVPRMNAKKSNGLNVYDLVIEMHLNYSSDPDKHGVCAYYQSGDTFSFRLANRFCKCYEKEGFLNLGVFSPKLHMLIESDVSAVIVELFYCTSKLDTSLSKAHGLKKMAEIFTMAINKGPYKDSLATVERPVVHNSLHGWIKESGKMSYYCQSVRYESCVENINGKYYYFDKGGFLGYGFKCFGDDNIYYFNSNTDGSMVIDDSVIINGDKYVFDKNGRLKNKPDPEKIHYRSAHGGDSFTIDDTLIIYNDDYDIVKIKEIMSKYPNSFLIRESDYAKYSVTFTNTLKV